MCFSRALLFSLVLVAQGTSAQPEQRLLAIGDIHGGYDELVAILTHTGLVDASGRWSGGRITLVQTGDFTDRGAKVRQVMDLLMAIEQDARKAGGEVVTLLGNHEVLNIIGDLRYVTAEIAAAFADEKSESRREREWKEYESLIAARSKVWTAVPPALQKTRDQWMAEHPPGWLEYREALGPRGRYGRWLRGKPIAAVRENAIFMHAGISPDHPASVEAVNTRAREEMARYESYLQRMVARKLALPSFTLPEVLEASTAELQAAGRAIEDAKAKNEPPDLSAFDVPLLREAVEITKMGEWSLLAPQGPLWFRGYANWPEDEATAAKVHAFLDAQGSQRIIVGHTPTPDARIALRFGGRVLVIDTGMLAATYMGRPSILEIRGTALRALYPDGSVPLKPAPTPMLPRY